MEERYRTQGFVLWVLERQARSHTPSTGLSLPLLPPPCHARSASCLQIEGVGNIDQGMWKSGQGARSRTYSKASEGEGKRWECKAVSHHTSFTQARGGGDGTGRDGTGRDGLWPWPKGRQGNSATD